VFSSRFTLLAFLLLSTCGQSFAFDPHLRISQYQKQHWQMEDGLPHNCVFVIRNAPDGCLLIGTDEGLAGFDGKQFTAFDLHPELGFRNVGFSR
jgi:ligand-binding sensor domain-containing protein